MVKDAERYKDEDDVQKNRVSAKNSLESYVFSMKSTMEDEKFKDKIPEGDKKTILNKCSEVLKWLEANQVTSSFVGHYLMPSRDMHWNRSF